MSVVQSVAVDSAVYLRSAATTTDSLDHHKRKLDDYASLLDSCDLVMKKHERDAVNWSLDGLRLSAGDVSCHSRWSSSAQCSCSGESSTRARLDPESTRLQFFIRMISEGRTIVVYADKNDTIMSLHQRIQLTTGIPVIEQRLIYGGKQLQYEPSLDDYGVRNDACLHLVGRMRSTEHPQAWQVMEDIQSTVRSMCRGEPVDEAANRITERLTKFFAMTPKENNDSAIDYLQIFTASSAPAVLVMLYVSSIKGNKECADYSIRHFLSVCRNVLPKSLHRQCALMVLEFCKLLGSVARDQPLYLSCRSTLGSMLETVPISWGLKNGNEIDGSILVQDILPFFSELADKLSKDLVSSMESIMSLGPLSSDVRDFSAFLLPLRMAILEDVGFSGPLPMKKKGYNHSVLGEEIEYLHGIFKGLLDTMGKCLTKIETWLGSKGYGNTETMRAGWSQYLSILKELYGISKLYKGAEAQLLSVLKLRKAAFCVLIIKFAKRLDDHQWILEYKDVTDFGARRHLVMMMFPDVKEDYEELHEMLIDRSHLLAESFEYIGHADPESLHGGLFMEFKNEEATGPGVLREWFFLVCQAIFNPQNALFVPCLMDRRRFYPNPASKVDPMHLDYFTFSGRVIALALMHKVQVGVLFDRVFFLQLAGTQISLEDIRDADPCMYSSCKQILKMEPEFIDSDALGLTFIREVEELGHRNVLELCTGGKSIAVNSKNRVEYVNLLIKHCFVTSISEQVSYFSRGFSDILPYSKQKNFFQSLELEDLDWMLYGTETAVSVEDWKAHTDYNGYKETDPEIIWFWKIVKGMPAEQRKTLLFFWTSMKFLPIEGFGGLASRLHIYKSYEPHNCLPSSHTCFYRLCLPQYPTMDMMKERLKVITQDHVSCSFGTW